MSVLTAEERNGSRAGAALLGLANAKGFMVGPLEVDLLALFDVLRGVPRVSRPYAVAWAFRLMEASTGGKAAPYEPEEVVQMTTVLYGMYEELASVVWGEAAAP